jgi:photosystem II stability/assembly factor-like uncharacterized protein
LNSKLSNITGLKFWAPLGICLLMLAVSTPARAAIEGQPVTSVPSWLGLFGVAIQPDGSIYAVGSKAALMVSTDHGKTWTIRTIKERNPADDLYQDRDLYSIRFAPDGKTGWIVGEDGLILKTTDGGDTWTEQDSGNPNSLFKVAVIDDQDAVAVGDNGAIVRTSDGGSHWSTVQCPKAVTLFDVTFLDKQNGWSVGEFSSIFNTTDGGQTWKLVYGGNTTDFTIGPFLTVIFTDPTHGVVAGLSGGTMVTSDGGKTWTAKQLPDQTGSYATALDSANKKLWLGGTGGKMFDQASDGTWQSPDRTSFHDITDMAFDGNVGVAVGLNGTILVTQNAGDQWQAVQ